MPSPTMSSSTRSSRSRDRCRRSRARFCFLRRFFPDVDMGFSFAAGSLTVRMLPAGDIRSRCEVWGCLRMKVCVWEDRRTIGQRLIRCLCRTCGSFGLIRVLPSQCPDSGSGRYGGCVRGAERSFAGWSGSGRLRSGARRAGCCARRRADRARTVGYARVQERRGERRFRARFDGAGHERPRRAGGRRHVAAKRRTAHGAAGGVRGQGRRRDRQPAPE